MSDLGDPDGRVRVEGPVDAVLRIPHPAALVGVSLGFLAAVAGLSACYQARVVGSWPAGIVITLVAAAVAAVAALILLTARATQTIPGTLAGLLVLDAVPVVMQFGSLAPTDARARVLFLVIPTVIAASSLAARVHRTHLVGVMVLAAVMVATPSQGRDVLGRIVESTIAVGVLLAADLLIRRLSSATAERIFQLRALSLTDGLTGVLNRRGLAAGFDRLIRTTRRDAPLGLLIVDIDHFKWFNDEYGHAAGDDVLRRVCQVLAATVGPGDLVARIGGEELAVLVVGRAEPVALAFRRALSTVQPRITVSIGIVDDRADNCTAPAALWHLLDAADQALYEAKNTGRDRICRGVLDHAAATEIPVTPVPQAAAVPPEGIITALPPSRLPGWALAVFGALGLASAIGRDPAPLTDWRDWLLLVVSLGCLVAGIALIGTAPRLTRLRLVAGVAAADLAIALAVVEVDSTAAKLTTLLPLALTGLMIAQHSRYGLVVGHHVVVGLICLLAFGDDVDVPSIAAVALHAAVLIGCAELIYWLRRRHDSAAEDLHRWSVTDPLTGLANRRGLELAYARMARTRNVTILALDVDDFKAVNDRHGHVVGDDTLIRLAATLRTVTGSDTVVGRTGGDEFVLLAPAAHAGTLTSKVSRAAALLPVPLSVSVGSTVAAPYHRLSLWQLVAAADAGLTRAKQQRRQAMASAERAIGEFVAVDATGPVGMANGPGDATSRGDGLVDEATRPILRAVDGTGTPHRERTPEAPPAERLSG